MTSLDQNFMVVHPRNKLQTRPATKGDQRMRKLPPWSQSWPT